MSTKEKKGGQSKAASFLQDIIKADSKTSVFLNMEKDELSTSPSESKEVIDKNQKSEGEEKATDSQVEEKPKEEKPKEDKKKVVSKKVNKSGKSSKRKETEGRYQEENGITYYVNNMAPSFLQKDLEDMVMDPAIKSMLVGKDIHNLIKLTSDLTGVPLKYIVAIAMHRFVEEHKKDFKALAAKRWSF